MNPCPKKKNAFSLLNRLVEIRDGCHNQSISGFKDKVNRVHLNHEADELVKLVRIDGDIDTVLGGTGVAGNGDRDRADAVRWQGLS